MRRMGAQLLLAVSLVAVCAACDRDGGSAGSTTTTSPPWTTDPDAEFWGVVDALCTDTNDTSLADAESLLPVLSTPPDSSMADSLAEFYRRRADQVDALVVALGDVTPPERLADDWLPALDGLSRYADWARAIAVTVEEEGFEADQTPPPELEDFRTLMTYGACHDLLDIN